MGDFQSASIGTTVVQVIRSDGTIPEERVGKSSGNPSPIVGVEIFSWIGTGGRTLEGCPW